MPFAEGPQSVQDVERWLVLSNRGSSSSKTARRRIAALQESAYAKQLLIIPPSDDPAADMAKLLGTLESNDGVISEVGDGGVHYLVNGILSRQFTDYNPPLLVGRGGNGNDTAKALLGSSRRPLAETLDSGSIRPIHPIESLIMPPDVEPYTRFGVSYMGIGLTAVIAGLLDAKSHRERLLYKSRRTRLLLEAERGIRGFLSLQNFVVHGEDGERERSEMTIANGSVMSKFGRWPVAHDEPRLYVSEVGPKSPWRSLSWLGRLELQAVPGLSRVIPGPEGYYLNGTLGPDEPEQLSFTLGDTPTAIHWDAESSTLAPHTRLTIHQSQRHVNFVHTQLAA